MPEELTIRICGEAGQGMQTIGMVLCKAFKAAGFFIFGAQDYMSRIRGGNNFFQLRVSNKEILCLRRASSIIVALDKASPDLHVKDLTSNGVMVVDKKKFGINRKEQFLLDIPLYDLAVQAGGMELFSNSAACGVIMAMTHIDLHYVCDILAVIFADKAKDIIEKNINAARMGHDYTASNFTDEKFKMSAQEQTNSLFMNGNDAIALGAIRAGCKFYSGYPMTPSTGIMNSIAEQADRFNIVVEQAEDEIAAINMIIGASYAGVRAMTATSGGGFCLMVEGVSLAGMTETPIVVVLGQRPGPATGFPTRTEQGELDFVLHAGHGEFARAVYAPGSIEEAFYLTIRAFNIAEKYQMPVIILTDQYLADSYRNIAPFDLKKEAVNRFIISQEDSKKISNYKRYQLTESGISPRALPSWINEVFWVDSDEHTEEGHITEDGSIRLQMVAKRFLKKMSGLSTELEKPCACNIETAEVILIGFGSTHGLTTEISMRSNKKIGCLHFSQIWPFPADDVKNLLSKAKAKLLTIENNAGSQLAKLLRRETGVAVNGSILRYDGRPFDIDYVLEKIQEYK